MSTHGGGRIACDDPPNSSFVPGAGAAACGQIAHKTYVGLGPAEIRYNNGYRAGPKVMSQLVAVYKEILLSTGTLLLDLHGNKKGLPPVSQAAARKLTKG